VRSNLAVRGGVPAAGEDAGTLLLDGLLLEGEVVVLAGSLGVLSIRHCTLGATDPDLDGGVRVVGGNQGLAVEVYACAVGRIDLGAAGGGLLVTDSVVGGSADLSLAPDALPLVVQAPSTDADVERSTLLGRVQARSIEATNTVFMGTALALQRQHGCVRFSYAPEGSRLARRFRCQPELAIAEATATEGPLSPHARAEVARKVRPTFTSISYGDAAYAQLALTCPDAIKSGGEGGTEMGVGSLTSEPFRRQNLNDVLDEYLPFGLTAAPIYIS
jgi:hypothetical protein